MSIPETIIDDECSICMSVLIKPVTLQCKHELCLGCLRSVLKQSFTCPVCRFKLKPSLTSLKNLNRHVNKMRWAEIKNRYPNRVNRKLNNEDTDSDENNLEFVLCVTQLKYEQEQKALLGSQVKLQPADDKPKMKGTKRKRNETSQTIPKVMASNLFPQVRKVRRANAVSLTDTVPPGTIEVQAPTIDVQPDIIEVQRRPIAVKTPTINVQPNIIEVLPGTMAVKAPAIDVQPDIIEVQPGTIVIQAPTIDVQPDIIEIQPNIIEVHPDIIELQPDIIELQPDINEVQPDIIEVQPEFIEVQPETIAIHALTIDVQPDIIEVQPRAIAVQPATPINEKAATKCVTN